ncbi:hypothetical protein [Helicobacter sp. 23-1045]
MFWHKISLNERLVLFRSFRAKTTQSTTAITSIVFHAIWQFGTNLKIKKIVIARFYKAKYRSDENIPDSAILQNLRKYLSVFM